jgi:hypothetical protein
MALMWRTAAEVLSPKYAFCSLGYTGMTAPGDYLPPSMLSVSRMPTRTTLQVWDDDATMSIYQGYEGKSGNAIPIVSIRECLATA